MPLRVDVVTLFPEMFAGPFEASILRRARDGGLLDLQLHQLREYATGPHLTVDDYPYGGGPGMVLKPEPLCRAIEAIRRPGAEILCMAANGRRLTQDLVAQWAHAPQLVLVCGHYEGIDERIVDLLGAQAVSIGDYVLTGGELPAMVVIDAVARLVPGVLGDETSALHESYSEPLLEYPQYTRPRAIAGREVPPVLLQGAHADVTAWRRREALRRTLELRPDLLDDAAWAECDRLGLLTPEPSDARGTRVDTPEDA